MNKPRFIIGFLLFTIVTLIGARVVIANTISTNGATLGQLQQQNDKYVKENTLLKEKVLTLSSLTNLASEAAKLGFVGNSSTISLSGPVPLALKK